MDTARYLKSQGWLGAGHALSTGKGISKPLLVSRKSDVLGLGKKHNLADQWWARAFDDSLSGLEVQQGDIGADGAREVTVTQTKKSGVLEGLVAGKGALYSMFVRGEGLVGTIGRGIAEDRTAKNQRRGEQSGSGDSTEAGGGKPRKEQRPSAAGRENIPLSSHAPKTSTPSKAFELKRERRRQRRAVKALRLAKQGDPSATTETDQELEEGGPSPRADNGLRRTRAEETEDAGITGGSAALMEGGGDVAASGKVKTKKRKKKTSTRSER